MVLRVAPCPKCQSPLVFGERNCRKCGQMFNYGARNPSEPSFAQVVEALRAIGNPPPSFDDEMPGTAPRPTANRAAPPAPAPHPRSIASGEPVADVPALPGIDTGRFTPVGEVSADDIPGFIDSTLYRAFTPARVDVAPVAGLDTGRAVEVGEVRVSQMQGVEPTAKEAVGRVRTEDVPGLFHSDFLRAPDVPIAQANIDGLERSPRAARARKDAAGNKRGAKRRDGEQPACLCHCGETHRLPRCPACGTPNKNAPR